MLTLVTADNFLQMFFGWEGVGLASYLLIGFYYKKSAANSAAIKAFIVNRVGDFGFALGIFGLFYLFGNINFDQIFMGAKEMAESNYVQLELFAFFLLIFKIELCHKSLLLILITHPYYLSLHKQYYYCYRHYQIQAQCFLLLILH